MREMKIAPKRPSITFANICGDFDAMEAAEQPVMGQRDDSHRSMRRCHTSTESQQGSADSPQAQRAQGHQEFQMVHQGQPVI